MSKIKVPVSSMNFLSYGRDAERYASWPAFSNMRCCPSSHNPLHKQDFCTSTIRDPTSRATFLKCNSLLSHRAVRDAGHPHSNLNQHPNRRCSSKTAGGSSTSLGAKIFLALLLCSALLSYLQPLTAFLRPRKPVASRP